MHKIAKALRFLELHLFDDDETLFPLTLILNSLGEVKSAEAEFLKQKIAKKLLSEKSQQDSFNYWLKSSKKFDSEPYPDDLDDTFCAWSALFAYDQKLVDDKVLLNLSNLLLFSQRQVGEPYYTWLVQAADRGKWSEIDVVVNINIARFFASQKVKVLGLEQYIARKIVLDDLASVFYGSQLVSLYFLSYFYRGKYLDNLKEKVQLYLKQNLSGGELLLLGITVLRFGFSELARQFDFTQIFNLQQPNGGISAFGFYKYFDREKSTKEYGSQALGTALFIEFLDLWKDYKHREKLLNWQLELQEAFRSKVSHLERAQTKKIIEQKASLIIYSKHADLAIFLPHLLSHDLLTKVKIKQVVLDKLALVNLYAWLAYTIYDDLNDADGSLIDLPIANLCLLLVFETASELPQIKVYLPKLCRLLRTMEENFLLEKNNQYLRNASVKEIFTISYRKSIGQLFSVYYLLNFYRLSDQKYILEIMRCIILLKQINDDLHDCFSDLAKGQISSVNYFLLKLNLKNYESDEAKIIFYQKIIPIINQKMIFYLDRAKNLLQKQKLLKQDNYFMKILSYYEKLITEGQRERENLLNYYHRSSK